MSVPLLEVYFDVSGQVDRLEGLPAQTLVEQTQTGQEPAPSNGLGRDLEASDLASPEGVAAVLAGSIVLASIFVGSMRHSNNRKGRR